MVFNELGTGLFFWSQILDPSNLDALDFRLVEAPIDASGRSSWKEVLPHRPGVRLFGVDAFADHLVAFEWADALPTLRVIRSDGSQFVIDQHLIRNAFPENHDDVQKLNHVFGQAQNAAKILECGDAGEKQRLLQKLVSRIQLQENAIEICIEPSALLKCASAELEAPTKESPVILTCRTVRVRRGHEIRLIVPPDNDAAIPTNRDQKLVTLVADARAAAKLVLANPDKSTAKLAEEQGKCRTRLAKLAAISCIAPDIITAIVEGRQPPSLDARALLSAELPLDWQGQRAVLGFQPA